MGNNQFCDIRFCPYRPALTSEVMMWGKTRKLTWGKDAKSFTDNKLSSGLNPNSQIVIFKW